MPPRIKMWSSTFSCKCEVVRNVELARQGRTNGGRRYFQLHISQGLKRLQPVKDRGGFAPRCARLAGEPVYPRKLLALPLHIHLRLPPPRRFDGLTPKMGHCPPGGPPP